MPLFINLFNLLIELNNIHEKGTLRPETIFGN